MGGAIKVGYLRFYLGWASDESELSIKNGKLKPAYNVQNAVDSGYVVGVIISSDRADYYTCKPMMELLNDKQDWKYENYVTDSGYDCNENFRYLNDSGVTAFIKPQDWEISKKRSYRNHIGKYQNMRYDEDEEQHGPYKILMLWEESRTDRDPLCLECSHLCFHALSKENGCTSTVLTATEETA